jgi:hypothetical protein
MASTKNVTVEMLREALEKQSDSLLAAIAKLIRESTPVAAAPVAEKKKRKSKKAASEDETGEPKPKREPNDWIKFAQRVEQLIRSKETADGVGKEAKMRTVVVKQFASHLKSQKPYSEWTDEDIVGSLDDWEPPTESKSAKKSATPAASESESEKPKRKWSDEAKASAAAKRAEKKAAKKAEDASEAEEEKPTAKKPAKKAAAAKKVDTRFHKWTHEGTDYWRNDRGDVVSSEMDWVGHWDGKTIDTKADQPEDLATAEFDEE